MKVLVVEDQAVLAHATADLLEDFGCDVVGPAATVAQACSMIEGVSPHAALVDLSLPDGDGTEVIKVLRDRGVFCAILSGYGPSDARPCLSDLPWLEKPVQADDLRSVIDTFAAAHRGLDLGPMSARSD